MKRKRTRAAKGNKQTYNFHEICQVELVLPVHESKLS